MAPRNLGVKASIALSCLLGLTIIAHTVTNNHHVRAVLEPAEDKPHRNHTSHHHHNRGIKQEDQRSHQDGEENKPQEEVKRKTVCELAKVHTFFTDIPCSFTTVADHQDAPISTKVFLACCAELSKIFDKLSASAFRPIKSGFSTNIEIITKKYNTDAEKFSTLRSIVRDEVRDKTVGKTGSASNEILWLTRSLLFVTVLFDNIEDKPTFYDAMIIAYSTTIKQYHNFIVRSLFSMIGSAVPAKEAAIKAFAIHEEDLANPGYTECLYESLYRYNDALIDVCTQIEKLFQSEASITIMHRT